MPLLFVLLAVLVWSLPEIVIRTWGAVLDQVQGLLTATANSDVPVAILAVISIIALVLPLIGIVVILWRVAAGVIRWAWSTFRPKTDAEPPAQPRSTVPSTSPRTAKDFTDEHLLQQTSTPGDVTERPAAAGDGWWRGRGTRRSLSGPPRSRLG